MEGNYYLVKFGKRIPDVIFGGTMLSAFQEEFDKVEEAEELVKQLRDDPSVCYLQWFFVCEKKLHELSF